MKGPKKNTNQVEANEKQTEIEKPGSDRINLNFKLT